MPVVWKINVDVYISSAVFEDLLWI